MNCYDTQQIGENCNTPSSPCDMANPCQNMGTCIPNITISRGYTCVCHPGFNGTDCELDIRPCKLTTCWNNGRSISQENILFLCYFVSQVLVQFHHMVNFDVHVHLDGKVVIVIM
jgi:hypothetical protein